MENKIDIIVPYVNELDKAWQKDFTYWKNKEVQQHIQSVDNKQAFAKERVRDWDAFQYWFRGVEKNCPWVNKIFLVVQRKSQLPKWLNVNNPKLRIVYHEEFIPKEFLPTFSTLVIETFYSRIEDLSEQFIVCNDDFYFINPIPENLFFSEGKIHQGDTGIRSANWQCGNKIWETIINNNNKFLEKNIIKSSTTRFIHYSHLPDGRLKSFEKEFLIKYKDEIYECMLISKFRHPKNLIPSLLYIDTMKYSNFGIIDKRVYQYSKYVAINSYTKFSNYENCEMICFNDTAAVDDFEICQNNLLVFLNKKLSNKSSFELYSTTKVPTTYLHKGTTSSKNINKADGRQNCYLYF